jgi:hypothetical protein
LAGSESTLRQVPPQLAVPEGQAHEPPTHAAPPEHAAPHEPQLKMLVCVSTHAPLHSESDPQPAAQVPFRHTSPVAQA